MDKIVAATCDRGNERSPLSRDPTGTASSMALPAKEVEQSV
jgi:hypothetical protein